MLLKAYPPERVQQTMMGMLGIIQDTASDLEKIDPSESMAHWMEAVDALAAARLCVDIAWDTNKLGYLCLAVPEHMYQLNSGMLNVLFEDLKRMSSALHEIWKECGYGA